MQYVVTIETEHGNKIFSVGFWLRDGRPPKEAIEIIEKNFNDLKQDFIESYLTRNLDSQRDSKGVGTLP